jgi:CubicO group peptidase (beta-lactamase class C family)
MKKTFFLVLLLFCFQIPASRAASQAESIRTIFDYLHENNLFNGAALVVDGGDVMYEKAFGYANVEWSISNSTDTKFEIGSVTKQFTAVLVLQLVSENKLSLADTISTYLPDMPSEFGDKITIHQLLTHTSGLPSQFSTTEDYIKVGMRVSYTFEERLEQLRGLDYEFEPGTSWSYNGFGYTILGEIVARVTNRSLEKNYQERIFYPLAMKRSGVFFDSRLVSERAYGYQKGWNDSLIPPVYFAKSKANLGGGGLYSTIEDLLKWHNALQGSAFLSEEIKKQYFSPHYQFGDGSGYCYGNYFERYEVDSDHYLDVYFHGGSLPGTSSLILRVPERNQCVVLLHNGGMGMEEFLHSIAIEILNVLNDKEFQSPRLSVVYPIVYTAAFIGIEDARKHYLFLKEHLQNAYVFGPDQLNTVAMILMQFRVYEDIPGLLKLNIDEYPEDFSAYYQLGKFYVDVEKNHLLAKEYLQKAMELSEGDTKDEIRNEIIELEKSGQGN